MLDMYCSMGRYIYYIKYDNVIVAEKLTFKQLNIIDHKNLSKDIHKAQQYNFW